MNDPIGKKEIFRIIWKEKNGETWKEWRSRQQDFYCRPAAESFLDKLKAPQAHPHKIFNPRLEVFVLKEVVR